MKTNTRCKKKFTSIIGYSKDKNIGDILIRSRLPKDYMAKVDP